MKLSVIIPVYNTEKEIGACLDSVLSQEISELEILCVDDASTDRSAEIIREYQKRDSRIHLLQNETNRYAGECRNRGIEAAAGEFLHFLDADDLVEPGAYQRVLSLAERTKADVVKGRGCGFGPDGKKLSAGPLLELSRFPKEMLEVPFAFSKKNDRGEEKTPEENPALLSLISVVPWNGIYRRSLLEKHQIRFNHLVCVNDRSFFNEVTIKASRIVVTNQILVHYRMQQGGSLMGRRAANFDCQFASYDLVMQQLKEGKASRHARSIVRERELTDLFYWYGRYRKLPQVGAAIEDQMKAFRRKHALLLAGRSFEKKKQKFMKKIHSYEGRGSIYKRLCRLLPVKSNLIVFCCARGTGYNGNPRAIYEEIVREGLDQRWKCVWFFREEKAPEMLPGKAEVVSYGSRRYFERMARARVWVFDSRESAYLVKKKGQFYLQTWHGTPLKKLALDLEDHLDMQGNHDLEKFREDFRRETAKWDALIVQNPFSEGIFRRCFAFDREFLRCGYPRNDALLQKGQAEEGVRIRKRLGIPEGKRVFLYAPTYRDDEMQGKDYTYTPRLDMQAMREAFGEDSLVIVKYHYFIADRTDWSSYKGFVYDFGSQAEIRELYQIADVLITDYSSVMFDYTLLHRPVYFYCYDLEKYREELRGFYFDFLAEAPGPISRSTAELIRDIREGRAEQYHRQQEIFYQKYHTYEQGNAAKTVVERIQSEISKSNGF